MGDFIKACLPGLFGVKSVIRNSEVRNRHDLSQAAYWDGRNNQNEPVASGIYFYQIEAGEFSATRRMLILK